MLDSQTEKEIQKYEKYIKSLEPIYTGTSRYGVVEVYHFQDSEPELHLGVDNGSVLGIYNYDLNISLSENIKQAEKEFENMMEPDWSDYNWD